MTHPTTALTTPLPAWLDRSLYPFTPRSFSTPEGTIRYLDEGEGPVVLVAHGTPSWSFEWREVVRQLRTDHRVIVPDHLGFGLSDKPGDPTILRPADHARRLIALADSLDLHDATLVVHDFGGPIGIPLALARPRRVSALVASNTWMWAHGEDRRIRWMSRLVASPLGRLLYLGLNASPRWLLPSALAARAHLTPTLHRHYLAPLGSWSERLGPWTLGVELAGSDAFYASLWERRDELARIRLRLAWGAKDPAFPIGYVDRWKSAFPHAKVDLLEVGHCPAEEAPDALVGSIRGVEA